MNDWKVLHDKVLRDFVCFLNQNSDKYVLKGDTALRLCYGLTRFSEDIDLDGFSTDIFDIIEKFVNARKNVYIGISYREAKNTNTVKRAFIHYGGSKPLKVEVSYRRGSISCEECTVINGILVYRIPDILSMKLNAFNHRDKLRDLYDIVFIYKNYKQLLNPHLISMLRDAVAYKGLEQFDYLIKDQTDDLVHNDTLMEEFLIMYYDLGLI